MDLLEHATRPQTAEEAHAPAEAAGALCSECALWACRRGPVMGQTVKNARLTVIGEAPGNREVECGEPFTGSSGVELDQSLAQGGLARRECTISNVVLCQPPEDFDDYLERLNRDHKKLCDAADAKGAPHPHRALSPIEACKPRLIREMQTSNAKTILAVGGKALRAIAYHYGIPYGTGDDSTTKVQVATIKFQHGSPVRLPDGTILASSLHPAFAMKDNRQYTQIIRDNITRAAAIVARGNIIDWKEPPLENFTNWPDQDIAIKRVEEVCAWFVANKDKARVKSDIETDSIEVRTARVRCIGFGMLGEFITVPLLWMDGREFWSTASYRLRAEAAIRSVLDNCELTFHNGLYDTAVLLERKLMTNSRKLWLDTLLLHRNTDANDLPHDLGFVVRQYSEAPLWKKDIDHKGGGGTTDADYHLYNGRDVLGTDVIEQPLIDRVVACGNLAQFKLDSALAPIARDMGRLTGIFIDERERGELSLKLNKITRAVTSRIHGLVGRPINPRSPPQLRKLFFEDRGYTPTLNTDGYEWELGEDPSTSADSLIKLLDNGVDENTNQVIEAVLEFKAADKLRGSYADNLRVKYDWQDPDDRTVLARVPAVTIDDEEILAERPELSWMPITWKIHVIPGGRWVCDPSIHSLPARGWQVDGKPTNTRRMIVAPPGHVIVGADYDQLELRIYGVVADDQYVLKAFRDGLDPHCLNAATIMAETEDGIMPLYEEFAAKHFKYHARKPTNEAEREEASYIKYIRTVAKRVVYLKNYGGEEDKLFSAMSAERDKATGKRVFPKLQPTRVQEWDERWTRRHPETKVWHRKVHDFLRQNSYVTTGARKRWFPGGPNKKNAPPNHEIQGKAGDIKNEAILRIHEEIPFGKWSRYTGLAIDWHDYLAVYVPESRADEAVAIINKCMPTEMTCRDGWKMRITAEAKASRNLADNA